MPLRVVTPPDFIGGPSFRFTVPGRERWRLLTVIATVARGVGGAPGRSYVLTVTDGTTAVAQSGADDAGTEPGTATITWAQAPASATASGNVGVSVAPLAPLILEPGYEIVGAIVNSVFGDVFTTAAAWVDFAYVAG